MDAATHGVVVGTSSYGAEVPREGFPCVRRASRAGAFAWLAAACAVVLAPRTAHAGHYVLSGGPSPGTEYMVDDYAAISLNGTVVYQDGYYAGNVAPFGFDAADGTSLTIEFVDWFGGCRGHSELWLHDTDHGCGLRIVTARDDGCQGWPYQTTYDHAAWTVHPIKPSSDATCPSATLSGTLTKLGKPLGDVEVAIDGSDFHQLVISHLDGSYSVNGLADGDYHVQPTLRGVYFTPFDRDVIIADGQDASGVDFDATPRLAAKLEQLQYMNVPSFQTIDGKLDDPQITAYGNTRLRFSVTLKDDHGNPQADQAIVPSGGEDGWTQASYTTDASGACEPQRLVTQPGPRPISRSFQREPFQFAFAGPDGLQSDPIAVPVFSNHGALAEFFVATIPDGPIIDLCRYPWLHRALCALIPGVANNLTYGANAFACGGYQAAVLAFLDFIRLDTRGWHRQWWLNGLDYGPVQYTFGGHQAVAVWLQTETSDTFWSGDVFDPWIKQHPTIYSFDEWIQTAGPLSVIGFGGSPLYGAYPTVNLPYPSMPASPPSEFNNAFASVVIRSPVDFLATGKDGARYGVDQGGTAVTGELAVVNHFVFPEDGGTMGKLLELGSDDAPYALDLWATGNGPVEIDVRYDGLATPFVYTFDVTAGMALHLDLDASDPGASITRGDDPPVPPAPTVAFTPLPATWVVGAGLTPTTGTVSATRFGDIPAAATIHFAAVGLPDGVRVDVEPATATYGEHDTLSLSLTAASDAGGARGFFPFALTATDDNGTELGQAAPVYLGADDTAPTTPEVVVDELAGGVTASTAVKAHWSASDPETGIARYRWAIATPNEAADAPSLMAWTDVEAATAATSPSLVLSEGETFVVWVRAENALGQRSEVGTSVVATYRTTVPPEGDVEEGVDEEAEAATEAATEMGPTTADGEADSAAEVTNASDADDGDADDGDAAATSASDANAETHASRRASGCAASDVDGSLALLGLILVRVARRCDRRR